MIAQALVVGAGPVGLTMAIELARYGVAVRVVDKATQRSDKSKAIVLWSRTLELLERSGSAGAFLAAGHKVFAANIRSEEKLIAQIDLSDVDSIYRYALMLPQSDTERLLETRLDELGTVVEREVELLDFRQDEGPVSVTLRHSDGRIETTKTQWLLGCDGAHSTTRHILDCQFQGDTLPSDWLLADVHGSRLPPPSEMAVYWHR